jgi:hypothetical protein
MDAKLSFKLIDHLKMQPQYQLPYIHPQFSFTFCFQPKEKKRAEARQLLGKVTQILNDAERGNGCYNQEIARAATQAFDLIVHGRNPRRTYSQLVNYARSLHNELAFGQPLSGCICEPPRNPFERYEIVDRKIKKKY